MINHIQNKSFVHIIYVCVSCLFIMHTLTCICLYIKYIYCIYDIIYMNINICKYM